MNDNRIKSDFTIRPFDTIEEFEECVCLQEEVWGDNFSDRVPLAILKVSQRLGGIAAGAYDDNGKLAGLIYGMTGVEEGEIIHWSDLLAIRPELRNSGLGARLKAYQREELLVAGITRVRWTFDPLESKNAHLNLNKLGAFAREYVEDIYGQTTSILHQGIGTDRFVPTWILDSERVIQRLEKGQQGPEIGADEGAVLALNTVNDKGIIFPGEPDLSLDASRILVPIPLSIQELKKESLESAVLWRQATRAVFSYYLSKGYEVRELYRRQHHSEYLLVSI